MTEEIINTCEYYKICESACGGTLEDTELCSCYQLYKQLKRLEQENKELKETVKDLNQSIQNCNVQRTKMYKALEEIKNYLNTLSSIDSDFPNTETYLRILHKINEVLQ